MKSQPIKAILAAITFVGAALAVESQVVPASATVIDPAKCATLTTAGNAVAGRAYSNSTIFNRPVACLEQATDSAKWATRWFENGNRDAYNGVTSARGDIDVSLREWSSPIYNGTGLSTRRVFASKNIPWNSWRTSALPDSIPWSTSWATSAGSDKELIVTDPTTGKEWGIWFVQDPFYWFNGCNLWNYSDYHPEWGDLCAGGMELVKTTAGTQSNYNKSVTTPPVSDGFTNGTGRGMGAIAALALVPTLAEVESGVIHHALNMETFNTMFGAACTSAQFGTPAEGVDCGYAVAPATKLEHFSGSGNPIANDSTGRSKTVPEGTRFALTLTDAQIDAWLDTRYPVPAGTPPTATVVKKRSTARIFAVALRDYGWFVSDTTDFGSSISADGSTDASKVSRWAALGMDVNAFVPGWPGTEVDGPTLLDGLITSATQVRTISIPVMGACPNQKCVNA